MHRSRTMGAILTALTALTALTGCGPDQSPVPTEAEGPFLCEVVPQASVELMYGEQMEVRREARGSWESEKLQCATTPVSSEYGNSGVIINYGRNDFFGAYYTDEESIVQILTRTASDPPERVLNSIDADAAGIGYSWASEDDPKAFGAVWVCDEHHLSVYADGSLAKDRDHLTDVENLLVSMLPKLCGQPD